MSYMSKFVVALVGSLLMALVASWELFLFMVMRDPSGLNTSGGRAHFWFAVGAGISAGIACGLMFLFSGRQEKIKWSKVELTPTGPPLSALGGNPFLNQGPQLLFDAKRWALANPWLIEGQADDRTPMDGSVTDSGETPSGQRAFARRTHQLMFKKWSQARHD